MKNSHFTLLFAALLAFYSNTVVFAQQVKSSSTINKGDKFVKSCETVSANFEICILCKDEAKTDCDKYWCSGGKCEIAPFKSASVLANLKNNKNVAFFPRKGNSEEDKPALVYNDQNVQHIVVFTEDGPTDVELKPIAKTAGQLNRPLSPSTMGMFQSRIWCIIVCSSTRNKCLDNAKTPQARQACKDAYSDCRINCGGTSSAQ